MKMDESAMNFVWLHDIMEYGYEILWSMIWVWVDAVGSYFEGNLIINWSNICIC